MKNLGLIGYPISHSGSPELFKEIFSDNKKILDEYSYSLLEYEELSQAAKLFYDHYIAVNVTAPFKEDALALADNYSTDVQIIGATNLLVKDDDSVVTAYNTDYLALRQMIPEGRRVLVLGCGGAGKGAAVAALDNGCSLFLYNRTPHKLTTFSNHLKNFSSLYSERLTVLYSLEELPTILEQVDIVVNTLSERVDLFDKSLLKGKLVIEANYKDPLYSDEELSAVQAEYLSGEHWLRLQALHTYRIIGLL